MTDLGKLDDQQVRYVAAIALAGDVEALAQALRETEQHRARLRHELVALEGLDRFSTFDVKRVERDLRARLKEWRSLLHRQTPLARQALAPRRLNHVDATARSTQLRPISR